MLPQKKIGFVDRALRAGGGDREDVALSYVYAYSGCVAASWLCVL